MCSEHLHWPTVDYNCLTESLFFVCIYLFILRGEGKEQGRGTERKRENPKEALCHQHRSLCGAQTHETMTWAEIKSQSLTEPPMHYITESLFYNKVLNISCNLLNTVLQVKNRMTFWVQNFYKCSPSWLWGWLGPAGHCHCPVSQNSIVPDTASLGKYIKIQNLRYSFS